MSENMDNPNTPKAAGLAVVINGDLIMTFDRNKRLPGVERRVLEQIDAHLDEGIEMGEVKVVDPDPMLRAQYVANFMVDALFEDQDKKAAAMCSWLATRIPDLQQVRAIDSEEAGSKIELIFDKSYAESQNEHTMKFMKLN
ncbi:MAG: hypothetical protein ACWA5X_10175 [bacterium]